MEFVDGQTLDRLLAEKGALTERQVRGVARQLLSALQFLHARNIVHRDIKPANVAVSGDF